MLDISLSVLLPPFVMPSASDAFLDVASVSSAVSVAVSWVTWAAA